jgi:hypothetical protein
MKLGKGALNYSGYGFVKRAVSDPANLRANVTTISNTKLKKLLYALINKRDKLSKKGSTGTAAFMWNMTGNWNVNGGATVKAVTELDQVNEAIDIITGEFTDRKLLGTTQTDTTDNGDKKE